MKTKPKPPHRTPRWREKSFWWHVTAVFVVFLAINFVAAGVIMGLEGYGVTDAFYLAMSASCLSGFGDVAPNTAAGRWFISFFQLFGFGWFFYLLSYIVVVETEPKK